MTADSPDDAALLADWCRGQPAAAQELYERHGAALLRFATAMLASRQAAEDVVHDTFVELLRRPERFDAGRGPLGVYLYGIARHRLSRVGRLTLREAPLPESESDEYADEGADEVADREQTIERVRAAVHALPFPHREVVALCDLEELPYATVAVILDCPVGTVRSRLHRARALLSTRLGSDTEAALILTCRGASQ